MSGLQNAIRISTGVIFIPRTCDGDGWWECCNLLEAGETLCSACREDAAVLVPAQEDNK